MRIGVLRFIRAPRGKKGDAASRRWFEGRGWMIRYRLGAAENSFKALSRNY